MDARWSRRTLHRAIAGLLLGACSMVILADCATAPRAESSTTIACSNTAHAVCVGSNEQGRIVRLRVHEDLVVSLKSSDQRFSNLELIGARILRLVRSNNSSTTVDEQFLALRSGTTTLQATEAPICAEGMACPQYVLLWRVEIAVRSS